MVLTPLQASRMRKVVSWHSLTFAPLVMFLTLISYKFISFRSETDTCAEFGRLGCTCIILNLLLAATLAQV